MITRDIMPSSNLPVNLNMKTSPHKPIRLIDVAQRAGVSRQTVSKVLLGSGGDTVRVGEETAKRVQRMAKQMGYTPNWAAQQLKGVSSRTLGMVLNTENTPVMTDRMFALEEEASRRGYRLLIGRTRHQPAEIAALLAEFESRGIDGLICLFDLTHGFDEKVRRLFSGRSKILFHGRPLTRSACCVRVDTAGAIIQLVTHLAECGYKRLGMGLENMEDKLSEARKQAYLATLKERGGVVNAQWIWSAKTRMPNPSLAVVDEAIDYLVGRHKVDAIIASNDVWAVHFIQCLKARGLRVPEDVAVTGYDNLNLATVIDPPLTTIDQCHEKYAVAALDLLLSAIHGTVRPAERIRTILPKLVIRGSTVATKRPAKKPR